jgi:glycosyltransferase involved in cell wall biosynthesis
MSLFSVVIPTYNRAALLQKTIASVLAQNYSDYEIIVADDGSTDETGQVLASFGDKIRVCRQENKGQGAARNLGARNSTSEYLAFLDSDDLWFPWTLSTYAQIIEQQNRPTLVAGTLVYFRDEAELRTIQRTPLGLETFADYYAASRRGHYCGSCQMVVRRDALLEIGGFAEEKSINNEDHDFVMRLGTSAGFVHVSSPAMIGYRQHLQALTRDMSKTFVGSVRLLHMEKAGRFPGGRDRRGDRRRLLTQHVRSVTLEFLRQKEYQKAWALYKQSFGWNLALGRFRYLAGFLLTAARNLV